VVIASAGKYRWMWFEESARRGVSALVVAGLLVAVGAGCADSEPRRGAVADAALRLLTAVRDGDGAAACAALAPETAAEVAESTGGQCSAGILDEDLPDPGPVTTVKVYGQWAEVVLSDPDGAGTVFLATLPGGWRVVAAGCRSRGERPYDCAVKGG
jgi:hypothetical protein